MDFSSNCGQGGNMDNSIYLIYVVCLYLFRKAVQLYNTLTKIPETI